MGDPEPPEEKFVKAPQAPRRFKSAYMFFSIDKHKEIRATLNDSKVSRLMDVGMM
jgi:hypothetical protein